MCNSLFVYFFFRSTAPAPALSFLYFFIPLLRLADTSGFTLSENFCLCWRARVFLWYFCCFRVSHTTVGFFLLFSFCTSFFVVAALLFDSIVSNRTTAQSCTLTSSPASVFCDYSVIHFRSRQRVFIIIIIVILQKGRAIESIFTERACDFWNVNFYFIIHAFLYKLL